MSDFMVQDGQTVVFIGDSITDCGRRDQQYPFGDGYVRQAIDLITVKYPERRITYFNEGIGGNNVGDLRNRWHDDLLVQQPDWVTIKIGINDLHQTFGGADFAPPRFEAIYRDILDLTRERTQAEIVLIDPFYMSTDDTSDGWRSKVLKVLPEYLDVVKRLAGEYQTRHVLTHEAFQRQLKVRPVDTFCSEPVHPNVHGHFVIAYELLKALNW